MTTALSPTDKAILTEIQSRFPLEHRPFAALAQTLKLSEQECVARIERLKATNTLWQITAVFDAKSFGYQRSLVAMRVDPLHVDEAAAVVNRHPGVSQNDRRDDPFNLWFAISVPTSDSLRQTVQVLHTLAGAEETLALPIVRSYKTRASSDHARPTSPKDRDEAREDEARPDASRPPLSDNDIALIRSCQSDLPLIEMPYAVWAEQAGITEAELFAWTRRMRQHGYLRRIAALLHPDAGMTANVLVVWHVPEEQVDRAGEEAARFLQVTQCDRRPVYAQWPYALYTKLHAQTSADCFDVASQMQARLGPYPRKHLLSLKEYRRSLVKFFSPELDMWWEEAAKHGHIIH